MGLTSKERRLRQWAPNDRIALMRTIAAACLAVLTILAARGVLAQQAADTIINAADYGHLIHDLALKRGLIHVGEEAVNRAFDAGRPESGREQIELAERELFELSQEGESKGEFKPFPVVLSAAIRHIESAWHKVGQVSGVPTRLTGLDQKLGGLQPSDLVILAGRPSMGKTALAVTIAANSASCENPDAEERKARHANYVVAVFSLEMSA